MDLNISPEEQKFINRQKLHPNQTQAEPILPIFKGETAVLIATGPSITEEQLQLVKRHQELGNCKVFTMNNVYENVPWTDVHFACGGDWWGLYYPRSKELQELKGTKYTWYPELAKLYNLNYVSAIVKDGLSVDPSVIHINHGSGPMSINLALHYGIKKLLLIGHDMKFAEDYDSKKKKVGSKPRHYFNEYPKTLQHWPSCKIGVSKPGVLDGLIETYEKMVPQLKTLDMEVVNCTPNSALKCFRMSTLDAEL